jgi:glycosyltransferase involved in cell wall biosynthesis
VRNGIDLTAFEPASPVAQKEARRALGVPGDAFVVGFAGRVTPQKGVPHLLRAWRRLGWPAGDARLLVAGPTDAAHPVPVSDGDAVHHLGFLADPRVVYDASDVMVVPSTWPDPCPRSVIEAMAAGRAVVASSIGGIPELVGHAGVLVAPADEAAIADALASLRFDRDRLTALSRAGRGEAERRLDLTGCVDEVERHLTDLVAEGRR